MDDLAGLGFFEIFILAGLVGISAFLSGSEVALFSLSRFQLRALRDFDRGHFRRVKKLLADPGGLLVSLLLVNEVVNVWIAAIVAHWISRRGALHPDTPAIGWLANLGAPLWLQETLLGIAITFPIVLIACEATPKVIGAKANEILAPLSSRPLELLYTALKPVRVALNFVLRMVLRLILGKKAKGTQADPTQAILKEQEFLLMVEEGQKEGELHSSEVELIKNVFELDNATVSDIATPLVRVQVLHEHTTIKTALQNLAQHRFSRIPIVAATNRKQVVGVLYAKDLLKAKLDPQLLPKTVVSLMRKPLYISSTLRLHLLFRRMKQNKMHIGVVLSSVGGTDAIGIVTMNDVLEALLEDALPDPTEEYEKGAAL